MQCQTPPPEVNIVPPTPELSPVPSMIDGGLYTPVTEDRQDIGSVQSQNHPGSPSFQPTVRMPRDSLSPEIQPDFDIGSVYSISPRKSLLERFRESQNEDIMSQPVHLQRPSTSGKTLQQLTEPVLSLESYLSTETPYTIGIQSRHLRKLATSRSSQAIFILDIIVPYYQLRQTMSNLWAMREKLSFLLDPPVQVNHIERGNWQEPMLILKIHARSSGVVIRVKKMLLSMNFGAVLMLVTYLDGQTNIQCVLKSKEVPVHSVLSVYGLQVISVQGNGTPILTKQHWMPYLEDWKLLS